jgi:hypothetical protein
VREQWQFEIDWAPANDLPVQFANQFAVQAGSAATAELIPDGIYVTVGFIAPPLFVGTPEQIERQMDAHPQTVPVSPLIKLVMSKERAQELVAALQTTIQQFEDSTRKRQEAVSP